MTEGILRSGTRTLVRSTLQDRAMRAASGLRAMGLQPGDRVAILMRNDLAFFEAALAADAIGACAVPVNWHLAEPEVAFVIADCDAGVLVAHEDLLAAMPGVVRTGVAVLVVDTPAELREAYRVPPAATLPYPRWDEWLRGHEPLAQRSTTFTDTMIYTSGTTGRPKGVRRLPQTAEAAARFLALRDRIYGIEPGMSALVCGPVYHGAPNAFAMRAVRVAAETVLMPRFDALSCLALIERHAITTMFMVPTMFVRLLRLPARDRARFDLSSLRHVVTAAAPCPPEVKAAMADWWGPIIHEFYAATELSYITACTPEEARTHPGTVGRPVDGAVLQVLGDSGAAVPVGQPGLLYGRQAMSPEFTYHGLPDARREIEIDGLVTGGDIGYLDEDGFLYLCDRQRDMVISGGVNIYPAEIESVLMGLPAVKDCAVFGVPDPEYGETLLAAVEPEPGSRLSEDDVVAYLRRHLASFKVPRVVELRERLPRDDSGKIYKRLLRDPHWETAGRRI